MSEQNPNHAMSSGFHVPGDGAQHGSQQWGQETRLPAVPSPQYGQGHYAQQGHAPSQGYAAPSQGYAAQNQGYMETAGYGALNPAAPFGVHPVTGQPLSDKSKTALVLLSFFLGGWASTASTRATSALASSNSSPLVASVSGRSWTS